MKKPGGWIAVTAIAVTSVVRGEIARAGDWTRPVEVPYNQKRCLSYRARLSGPFLVVEATPDPGWHTFAMDNRQRAAEKLQGRKSLSQDMPTEITLTRGLVADGPWFQSPPKDFSRPELRWYSWGFEDRALFVTKVRRSGPGPALITVRGQACTETICRRVDIAISLPLPGASPKPEATDIDRNALVQVR